LIVHHPFQAALLVADPAPAVISRAELGARAEPDGLIAQRFVDAELAAELDVGGDAVAEQLGDREGGVEAERRRDALVTALQVARSPRTVWPSFGTLISRNGWPK
jgi:hypothetical protein